MSEKKNLTLHQAMSPFVQENNMDKVFNENYMMMLQQQAQRDQIPPEHVKNFIMKAVLKGADPRKDEVYLVPRYTKKGIVGTVIFSKHYLTNKANETGEFLSLDVTTAPEDVFNPWTGEDGRQLVSTAVCYRNRNGQREKITYKARWNEYVDQKSFTWKDKGYIMLEKCAEAGVLRRAFPEVTSNVFLAEEFNGVMSESDVEKYVETKKIEEQKTEKLLEKATDDKAKKADIIEAIRELSGKITASFSLAQKGEYMTQNLGVQKFDQLKNKTVEELKSVLELCSKIKIEPIIIAKEDDLPF